MRPRWRKVLADLWGNKARTLLVVASIAVGVLAIGVITGTYVILANDLNASYASTNPSNITIRTYPFTPQFTDVIDNVEGVQDVDGRRTLITRFRRDDGTGDSLNLVVIPDLDTEPNTIHQLLLLDGKAIPGTHEILMEHQTLDALDMQVGDTLEIELSDGTSRALTIVGAVLDQDNIESLITGENRAFIAYNELEWLHQPQYLDQLLVTVSESPSDEAHIRTVADAVTERLEKSGRIAFQTKIAAQNQHPLSGIIEALLLVLIIVGILILFLSGSLIFNTMSALLGQHLRQIGVMKLVGSRRTQVIAMYVLLIASFGIIALLIAIPAGAIGAYALADYAAGILNFQMQPFYIVPQAIIFQLIVGMVVPPLAGLLPVMRGARITVRQALSSSGLGDEGQAHGWLDKKLTQLRGVSRPVLIALRNTFRQKGRLALTLFTLTLGGAVFIAVFNTQASLNLTTAQAAAYFGADVSIDLSQPYRINAVTHEIASVPGVKRVETWTATGGEVIRESGGPADSVTLIAPPGDTTMVTPQMLEGRWLLPEDENAIAVNEVFWDTFPNLAPGDTLKLKVAGREDSWTVVGIFRYTGVDSMVAYANYEYISTLLPMASRASMFRVETEGHSLDEQQAVASLLEPVLRDAGYDIDDITTGKAFSESLGSLLGILTSVLLVMALMTALVGSIGLTGTMSMNVMERTREIGVMRAIGANNSIVSRLVIIEGLIIGVLSYVLGLVLSLPISVVLSNVISQTIFSAPASLVLEPEGIGVWALVVLVLSILASLLPAKNASRLTIREVLAYE